MELDFLIIIISVGVLMGEQNGRTNPTCEFSLRS